MKIEAADRLAASQGEAGALLDTIVDIFGRGYELEELGSSQIVTYRAVRGKSHGIEAQSIKLLLNIDTNTLTLHMVLSTPKLTIRAVNLKGASAAKAYIIKRLDTFAGRTRDLEYNEVTPAEHKAEVAAEQLIRYFNT